MSFVNNSSSGRSKRSPIPKAAIFALLVAVAAGVGLLRRESPNQTAHPAIPPSNQNAPASESGGSPSAKAPPQAAPNAPTAPSSTNASGIDPSTIRYGIREPKAKTPGTIRLATFNIENLFDNADDPALSGRFDDKSMAKPADHMKAAAKAIAQVNADVLALQEVESYDALIAFRDTYLKDLGYDHVVSVDAGDPRGIEQSVLSRFPLSGTKIFKNKKLGGTQPSTFGSQPNSEAGQPFEFKRSPLQVTVEVPNSSVTDLLTKAGKTAPRDATYKLTLLVVHNKSGREFDEQRFAEVQGTIALAADILKADPKANIMILGDFNATQNLPSLRQFEPSGFTSIFEGRDPRDTVTMTHSSGRCIDHIFFNKNLRAEIVPESRFVLGLPARPANSDWNTTPAPAGYASDHYPVVIDVRPLDAN